MADYITFQPTDHFNTLTYSGNGGNGTTTTQAITGAGFQPDWVWLKQRTSTQRHQLCDVIRGANNILNTDTTNGQVADSEIINSFDSDGFTAGYQDQANDTGQTYVSWLWKAGGAASSNSDGNITSQVSANTTAGFSIVKYTGNETGTRTIGHGLGAVPKAMIIKQITDDSLNWVVYHHSIGATKHLLLNNENVESTSSAYFADTTPTSSVFSLGGNHNVNQNSKDFIAYCFAEKSGYSKFGLYEGNGNADGTFVYTGFKPAWILIKGKGTTEYWHLYDSKRLGYNATGGNARLIPGLQNAETTTIDIDILSNGFKQRSNQNNCNGSGQGYVYFAFAEEPLVSSNNIPCTAR